MSTHLDPLRRHHTPLSIRDRARGCLLGGAVGDALGAPVEFLSLRVIRARYGPDGVTEMAPSAYGRAGLVTDDTQMTLFTDEGLLEWAATGEHDPRPALHRAYLRWLDTQFGRRPPEGATGLLAEQALWSRRAPGLTCLGALSAKRLGTVDAPLNDSKGCGGVMRAAPAGLVARDDAFILGRDAAAITHGHPSGYLSAGCLALMVRRVLEGTSLEDAVRASLDRVRTEPRSDEVSAALEAALAAWRAGPPSAERVESLGGGWTGEEALAIAVYSALAADGDFARGVRLAANHSGDTDSTAAIAGNLLGALLGEAAIPASWLDVLELRETIVRMADALAASERARPS